MAFNPTNPNGQATSANSAPVVLASDQSAITVKQNDLSSSGSLTAVSTYVTVSSLQGVSSASIQVTGAWVGTLTPQVSIDGTNYIALSSTGLINVNTGGFSATIASAATGIWQTDIAGFNYFRVGMTAYTSGTAVITIKTSNATGAVAIDNPLPTGANVVGAVTQSGTWSVNLGTGGTAATSLGKAEDAASASGDTGVFILGVRRDAAVVSASTTGDYNEIRTDQYGQQAIIPGVSGTETITRVTAAASSTVLLAANTSRKGASFYNESTAIAYLKRGTTASVTSYTVQIPAGGYYELPQPIHQGGIDCIWAAANGAMQITEVI